MTAQMKDILIVSRDIRRSECKLEIKSHVFIQQHTPSIGLDVGRVGSHLGVTDASSLVFFGNGF